MVQYEPAPRSGARARERHGLPRPGAVIGAHGGVMLRYASDDDSAAIVDLVATVWSEYPGKRLVAAHDMPELLTPATSYARWGGCFWVVEANGEVIGTVALAPTREDGVVELQKLYVARTMRRNGLGTFLCRLVEREARARRAGAVELWSDVKLRDAHRRYERLGYRRGEDLKAYADTSATVRAYYRKELAADGAAEGDDAVSAPWHLLIPPANSPAAPSPAAPSPAEQP